MPGLRWTPQGAVTLPETLQIRIEPVFTRRIAAGAPSPGRSLTLTELRDNLSYFVSTGPRGRPVDALVLSGLGPSLDPIGPIVREARDRSVRRVVAHVDGTQVGAVQASSLAPVLDVLVVAVRTPDELESLGAPTSGARLDVVVPLEPGVLPHLVALAAVAERLLVPRITFTWPFPGGAEPAAATDAAAAIASAAAALGRVEWTVKGLPPCLVGEVLGTERVSRSANRWYVDADHQRERALLFFPDVVRYAKREVCRFCTADVRCDGVADRWLREGRVPEFHPRGDVAAPDPDPR
ncbi:MAG: hypothetical protein ABMA64_08335 [Myxococcota bacterium]